MDYSPKLKVAMEDIKEILKKHDIAGSVVIQTPGYAEYLLHIKPSYSCARLDENGIMKFKAKKDDFGSDARKRDQQIADTANMLNLLSDVSAQNTLALLDVSDKFDKIVEAEHGPSRHTGHNTNLN